MYKRLILSLLYFLLITTPGFSHSFSITGAKLTLNEAINIALKNNPQITQTEKQITAAHYKIQEARAAKKLKLDLTTTMSRQSNLMENAWSFPDRLTIPGLNFKVPIPFIGNIPISLGSFEVPLPKPENVLLSSPTTYDIRFALTQPIYTGGKLEGSTKQARLNKKLQELNYEKTKQDIIYQVKKSYYATLKTKQLVDVTKKALDITKEKLRINEVKLNAGQISKVECSNRNEGAYL